MEPPNNKHCQTRAFVKSQIHIRLTVTMHKLTYFEAYLPARNTTRELVSVGCDDERGDVVQRLGEDLEENEGEWAGAIENTTKTFLTVGEACVAIF